MPAALAQDLRSFRPDAWLPPEPDPAHRYYDPRVRSMIVKVLPCEHYVTRAADEVLVTVLGSCVAACIRDPVAGVGGMNHFMLPGVARWSRGGTSSELRYGQVAMERLLNDLIKQGACRSRLEIKLFGGADVLRSSLHIGDANATFVRDFLDIEGLTLAAEDLGGRHPRRILYWPKTGHVKRLSLRSQPDSRVFDSEHGLRDRLRARPIDGDVELFA